MKVVGYSCPIRFFKVSGKPLRFREARIGWAYRAPKSNCSIRLLATDDKRILTALRISAEAIMTRNVPAERPGCLCKKDRLRYNS